MGPSIFWLVLFILFSLGEAATVGLTSIWFALGALATLIVAGTGVSISVQLYVFLSVSGLSMLLLRPVVKKYLKPNIQATNTDRLIGATAMVTETVDNICNMGAVQIHGQIWSASSMHDQVIPEQSKVKILEIQGVKLIVEMV